MQSDRRRYHLEIISHSVVACRTELASIGEARLQKLRNLSRRCYHRNIVGQEGVSNG